MRFVQSLLRTWTQPVAHMTASCLVCVCVKERTSFDLHLGCACKGFKLWTQVRQSSWPSVRICTMFACSSWKGALHLLSSEQPLHVSMASRLRGDVLILVREMQTTFFVHP